MVTYADLSEMGIVNGALARLQVDAIADLDDPHDRHAVRAKFHYPRVRDALQRAFRWNFNKRRGQLPASPDKPPFGYTNAFRLSPDCIAVREVDGYDWEDWEVEGDRRLLISASAPLNVTYSFLETDPARWDALFRTLMEYELAVVMAPKTARDEGTVERIRKELEDIRRPARIADGRDSRRQQKKQSRFLSARLTGFRGVR